MDLYEKYYRRSYNAINKLIDVYRHGYSLQDTYEFRKKLIQDGINNPKVLEEEQKDIMITILIALLGLNKESMEDTKKFSQYGKATNVVNIRNMDLTNEEKFLLSKFDTNKQVSTDFDLWLNILTPVPSDTQTIDHLRRVRNGFLHSNFYIDDTCPNLNIAHIKTKSYYESEVLIPEFQTFVFEYFSNIEKLGMTEKLYTFNVITKKISDRRQLIEALSRIQVNLFEYENLKVLGKDTPEMMLMDSLDKTGTINVKEFDQKISESNNFSNFRRTTRPLEGHEMAHLCMYIDLVFGDSFYGIDRDTQLSVMGTYLEYMINPKREISNWLMHFWYLYATLYNGKFNSEFFLGDEFGSESSESALMILKAYLLTYRLQNNNFDEIDYSKIDFDIKNPKVKCESDNIKTAVNNDDYFMDSFLKEKTKNPLAEDSEIWNKIICEVLRNSLAHGNVKPYKNLYTFEPWIELKDIDQKKGNVRTINMPLDMFERLLNSEAFHPKHCYSNTSTSKVKVK